MGHGCGITDEHRVTSWEHDGEAGGVRSVASPGVDGVIQVVAGDEHACARRYDESVWCWGSNRLGQLGDGTRQEPSGGHAVEALVDGAVWLQAQKHATCAWTWWGDVSCWGRLKLRRMWLRSPRPLGVATFAGAVRGAALGDRELCAWFESGEVRCLAGRSDWDGDAIVRDIAGLADVVQVVAGGHQWCALTSRGAVACWAQAETVYGVRRRAPAQPPVTIDVFAGAD